MPTTLEQVTKDAMDLAPRQKLALAEFLLESADAAADPEADAAADPEAEAAWDSEIRDRITASDEAGILAAIASRRRCWSMPRAGWRRVVIHEG